MNKFLLLLSLSVAALSVAAVSAGAQETEPAVKAKAATLPSAEEKKAQPAADKKMVGEARINLQTTVTGNQEQPRVMYILPWQSPASPELEMEMLSSQEDAVFGHVERDELARELEAADDTQ
jgi:hypothetical protein